MLRGRAGMPGLMASRLPAPAVRAPVFLAGSRAPGSHAMEQLRKEADALVERQQASQRAEEELHAKLQDRQAECSRLERQLAQAQGANAALRSSAADGERQIKNVQEHVTMVAAVHDALKQDTEELAISGKQAEILREELSVSFDHRFQCFENLECRIVALKDQHLRLTNDVVQARKAVETTTAEKADLHTEHKALQAKLQDNATTVAQVSSDRDALQQTLQKDGTAFQQRLAALQEELQGKRDEAAELSKTKSQLLAHIETTERELTASRESAEQQVAELQAKIVAAAKQHETDQGIQAQAAAETIKSLEQKLSDTQQEATMLHAQLEEQKKLHTHKVTELQDQHNALETSLSAAHSRLGELTTDLANSSAALTDAKHQGAKALAEEQVSCRQAINKANNELDNWKERVAREMETKDVAATKAVAEAQELQLKVHSAEEAAAKREAELEAVHAAALKALQDSSAAEKEELQKRISTACDASMEQLETLQKTQAATAAETKALVDKAAAITAELETAKAAHAEEVARLRDEADEQRQEALAALQADAERRLAAGAAQLAEQRDKLAAANACTAELEERLQVERNEVQAAKEEAQALQDELVKTKEELMEKMNRAEKQISPHGPRQKPSPPARGGDEDADDDEPVEEEPPRTRRRGRPTPQRFSPSQLDQPRRRRAQKPLQREDTDSEPDSDSSQDDDASSDGAELRVQKRRREAGTDQVVFSETQRLLSQGGSQGGGGRKTMFSTMSVHTQTDNEDRDDVPRNTYKRKGTSSTRQEAVPTSSASLLRHKGGSIKKVTLSQQNKRRKAPRGPPPGPPPARKRGPSSSAINLFGNTDPYAFAASPV